ncbi:Alkyl hydroperoxide reductase subunit F [Corynebacterium ciconiae DSM 44920]|uniref:NAD(P)/FAD-dependent oxidoreductase n=1 Tax=Corynebacterium ciconiae TaxID=227319 RepID=UPI00037C9811|nr:NAD(P)/FAD-dependent oxidoreductase [Corynebacterium ciconiae]WKD61535.1 Alkyl hydroperoxide reductase subunit F [Corynebacterium ciconiae DSM 44920]
MTNPTSLPLVDAEVIVVGGGGAGATAALLLGRQRRMTIHIDKGDYRNAPSPAINMLAASNGISPSDYMANARAALRELDTVVAVREQVRSARTLTARTDDGQDVEAVEVTLAGGRVIVAQRLILATGQHDHPNVLPGAAELWGTGVLHCPYCHGYEAKDSAIAVVHIQRPGAPMAGLLACYQALYLRQRLSDRVTLITEELPPAEHRSALESLGVRIIHARTQRIHAGESSGCVLRTEPLSPSSEDQATEEYHLDHVFFHAPTSASLDLSADLELETQGPFVLVDAQQRTSNPLVFAAGDTAVLRGTAQPLTFVAQAQAQGQAAALWADQDLFFAHPHTPAFPSS